MNHVIVTGASRGLGEAIVRHLLQPQNSIFCVSRSLNEPLLEESNSKGIELHWVQTDLSESRSSDAIFSPIVEQIDASGSDGVCLINNAAVLEPLGLVGTATPAAIERALHVNLVAPMVLTQAFVEHFTGRTFPRTVINISSGAGNSPMPGLSTYSTTKAALNMFTRAAAEDQKEHREQVPIRFFAVSPGTVDTAMQDELRSSGEAVLPQHKTYVGWKEQGSLIDPTEAARRVLTLIDRNDVESGSYVHARDLQVSQ
jgi:benzil reductase ((S)-benzoin forming)